MTDFLEIGGVIEVWAVGRIMAFLALGLANPGEGFARLGMAVSGAVAGFTLDILEVSGQVFFRLSVAGGVALQATGIGSFVLCTRVW